jgi:hypothetical protein
MRKIIGTLIYALACLAATFLLIRSSIVPPGEHAEKGFLLLATGIAFYFIGRDIRATLKSS